MMATSHSSSPFGRGPTFAAGRAAKGGSGKGGEKQAIWVPMLNSASKGKDLAEKQLVVLGGTPEQQREFLETLGSQPARPRYGNDRRRKETPPVSNKYALGYTYQDVLDADQEDILARLNVYLLASPSASFAPMLKAIFTKKTVSDTLITILLDWSDPFKWPRQLRQWVRWLRSVILSLDDETKIEMEETMTAWKERRVGPDAPSAMPGGSTAEQKLTPAVPLGPGEWDEGLGMPLSVVCVNAEKIERLERDYGWQEEQFDFLMQWLRCVLLKHGASLVYTTNYDPNHVRTLLHSSLSIHSLLKREVAKHNVIDRDKILVPPNWDSWGKIRILKEGFDPETIGNAWAAEIQDPPEEILDLSQQDESHPHSEETSAVSMFEAVLPDPAYDRSTYKPLVDTEVVITAPDNQTFLTQQAAILETLKAEDEKAGRRARKGAPAPTGQAHADLDEGKAMNGKVAEQIGPYQINVNGIDFDAEEATRRIRERETERNRDREKEKGSGVTTPRKERVADSGEAGKPNNKELASFFDTLMKKGKGRGQGGVSGSVSPTRGSPARIGRLDE